MSQEDLANELDVSRQAVFKWENDGATPDINKVKKMAKLFGISFNELLDDDIDITRVNSQTQQTNQKTHAEQSLKKYRKVFNSQISLKYNQSDIDHGYTENRKNQIFSALKIFQTKLENENKPCKS